MKPPRIVVYSLLIGSMLGYLAGMAQFRKPCAEKPAMVAAPAAVTGTPAEEPDCQAAMENEALLARLISRIKAANGNLGVSADGEQERAGIKLHFFRAGGMVILSQTHLHPGDSGFTSDLVGNFRVSEDASPVGYHRSGGVTARTRHPRLPELSEEEFWYYVGRALIEHGRTPDPPAYDEEETPLVPS